MAVQLTLSCDSDKTESGPTLIHSTGVEHYKIPPEIIRILQETLTNDLLSDHEKGVLCQDGSQRIIDILVQNGFTLENQTDEDGKTVWTLVQGGGNGSEQPANPDESTPNPDEGNEGDAAGENNEGEDEAGNKDGEEQEQAEE